MEPLRPQLSVAIIALLFIDLFVPFAYAYQYYNYYGDAGQGKILFADASPSPEPVLGNVESTCLTSVMDAAEVSRYQNGLAAFQAEQISTLSDEALRKNDPTDKQAQQVQINVNINDQPVYDILDVANLLEYDEKAREDLAAEFGINKDNGKLTREQLRAVAARKPGGQDAIAKFLGISSGGEIPKAQYENFKVVLPNGKSVALKDIMAVQPQATDSSCLIDRSFIKGKVTFQAQLNKDLYLGFSQSKTTVSKPQHLTTSQTTAALNSYAGSMVIPKMYEKYVTTVGEWSTWEMWASLAGSATILLSKKGPNELKEQIEDKERMRKEMAEYNARTFGGTQTEVQDQFTKDYNTLIKTKDLETKELRNIDFEVVTQQWRPLTIAIMGASWMGAARIALSASNQILLSSLVTKDNKFKDNYLLIYVNNNDFVEGFREATDFFSTGKITDWISDLMETGAPTKAFETGKTIIMMKEASQEYTASESHTSFETDGGAWQVKVDWKDRAESSLFEDIRKAGDYTSFALYSNNLELGTTLRNQDDFGKYYQTLAIAAPLLQFVLMRKADLQFVSGPVASIARAGIFDIVVTKLVDPLRYSKDEICDEGIVDNSLLKYKIFTGASMAQSLWSVYSPSKGLLQALGGGLKTAFIGEGYKPTGWLGSKYSNFFRGSSEKSIFEVQKKVGDLESSYSKTGIEKTKAANELSQAHLISDPATRAQVENAAQTRLDELSLEQVKIGDKIFTENSIIEQMHEANALEKARSFSYSKMETAFEKLYKGLVLLDPIQLGKSVVASNGLRYVSLCKDTSYKILAYQRLSEVTGEQNAKKKFEQLQNIDIGKQLNLTGVLGGMGEKVEEKSLSELLNLRAFMDDPYGQLQPSELYYIHLDGASQQWFGVYDKLKENGCFRECFDSKGAFICADSTGVTYTDKQTGKSIKLSENPDRGLLSLMMQDLARTIVPNRIISAPLDLSCSENEILQVQPQIEAPKLGGSLIISDDSCGTIQCLRQQLKVLKSDISTDLSASAFGDVIAVYTTEGRLTASEGKVRFLRGKAKDGDNETIGVELQAPSIEAAEEDAKGVESGNLISIKGNMEVSIKGYLKDGKERREEKVGTLLTIIMDRGKIEYDELGGRLVVALYVLAKTKANDNIKSISTTIRSNTDENGNSVPSIAINNVNPKVGGEADAEELNEALKKVQTDANGNLGGFEVFETADKKYTIGTDENGKPVLTIYDKNTGEKQEYQITGPLRREGNDIIVPTEKGDFKFNFDMKNGQPTLSASGPDGFKEIAALLAAKGPGGIIAFDPRTGLWYALNGQDIPWNQDFAKRGLTFYNTPDGTRGVAADNLYGYSRAGGSGNAYSPGFSITSFPENQLYAALMVFAIVLGVVAIRINRRKY